MLALLTPRLMAPAYAKDPQDHKNCAGGSFIGLWKGLDPADGCHQILSIVQQPDCSFQLLLRDSFWSLCGGADRGVSSGTGHLDGDLLRADDFTLTCFNNGNQTSVTSTFEFDKRQGILIRTRVVLTPTVVNHKTSTESAVGG